MDKRLFMLVVVMAAGLGCRQKVQEKPLDTREEYLLVGFDAVAAPGQTVSLQARLQKGTLLRDQEDEEILFLLGGKELSRGRTDDDGIARVDFPVRKAGDYRFTVRWRPAGDNGVAPVEAPLLVSARQSGAAFVVIDIDKTLAATRKRDFLSGKAKPLPGAAAVVKRLAGTRTVIYLTHRPDHLARRTKAWLADNGFPAAPLFGSRTRQFLGGSAKFKRRTLSTIRKVLTGPGIGIGDRISDMEAYVANGLKAVLIVDLREADAGDLRELADDLDDLPASVQVTVSWHEIENVLIEGASQGRPAMQRRLRKLADEMKRRGNKK